MILDIKNVSVLYKNKDKNVLAVDDVSLQLGKGESLGIVGESGSGKSTLAMAMLRLLPNHVAEITGEVIYNGEEILHMQYGEFNKRRWKDISVVFQKSMNALSPVHKIGEQFEDIYLAHDKKVNKESIKKKVLKLFEFVNLSKRVYNLYPHELSGGMLQRISIALSLLLDPSLIILDEATTALDVVTQGQILNEIKKLEEQMNMTRIMITHDMSVVATVCEKVAVMYAGRLMEIGKVKDVLTKPIHPYTKGLIKAYPTLKGSKENLEGMEGALPDLSEHIEGCVFSPRCNKSQNICKTCRPKTIKIDKEHSVACHFVEVE